MENISLQIINLRVNKEMARTLNQIYLNKNPDFQREYEAWDDKLKTRFIESILLNRATNPIWTVLNEEDKSEEVLDGMHRITTALAYFNNQFSLHKNHFTVLDGEKYGKKKFEELDLDDQSKIRNYNFVFNKLDSSYRKDMNKLQDMYEILNRSSKTLNDYEFNKVLHKPLYDLVTAHKENFIKSGFFDGITDERGAIETEILEMLIMTFELPKTWSSINNLKEDWINENVGNKYEDVTSFISNNKDKINDKLTLMIKIINILKSNDLISTQKKEFNTYFVPYKFIISRNVYLIKNISLFNRLSLNLISKFKSEITTVNIQDKLECKTRNAVFQRKLINLIDSIIEDEINKNGNEQRLFPKKMILEKLKIQNNICPICNNKIKQNDQYEGDHIISWTSGGTTTIDNLQVLHKRCHQIKSN